MINFKGTDYDLIDRSFVEMLDSLPSKEVEVVINETISRTITVQMDRSTPDEDAALILEEIYNKERLILDESDKVSNVSFELR